MTKPHSFNKIVLACSVFLAFGSFHLNAISEVGVLAINGKVTSTTCAVNIFNFATAANAVGAKGGTANSTLRLGSVTPSDLNVSGLGSAGGIKQINPTVAMVSLTADTTGNADCTAVGASGWEITFSSSNASSVTTASGTTNVLKSTSGASDSIVGIKTKVVGRNAKSTTPSFTDSDAWQDPNLRTSFQAAAASGIAIQASWGAVGVQPSAQGEFAATLTMTITY